MPCLVDECGRECTRLGLCPMHYQRMRAYGSTDDPRPASRARRFWLRVEKTDGCWFWLGQFNIQGYGRYSSLYAHRIAYELARGPIPDGLTLDHLCQVPYCVNPDHLEPVTGEENTSRYFRSMTHCKNGHPFDADNTYRKPSGHRGCRACNKAAVMRYKARRNAA